MRPRLKPFHLIRTDGVLELKREPGVYFELSDEDGQVEALLTLLDGEHDLAQIHAALPGLSEPDIEAAVKALDANDLLVDADAEHYGPELDRYASNLAFFSTFASLDTSALDMHQRLRDAHVVLLGVGGLGSTLLLSLAGAGVGRLTVVDNDNVEIKNLTRQFLYTTEDVGQPKLERALARARAVNPELRIDGVSQWVTEPGHILPLIDGADLVLCGIDKPAGIRNIVGRACVTAGAPMLTGGMWASRGTYYGFIPGRQGCIDCKDNAPARLTWSAPVGKVNRAMGPMAAVISGMMAMDALRLLTGFAPPVSLGRLWLIDLVSGETAVHREWDRLPDCPTCGHLE
ncbi:HesA/MoeB/ThiF family protein [Kutzneria sp. NPDC052558]|uniref:HesA/MoeB/ThiF family protein n=1 Tax=Kutzneria sp. NPDC052558 TaxID=3364121 RepID=UPI0037CA4C29